MATQTTNYNLVKPDGNETADIQVVNNNMDILDTKLKEVDNKASNITVPTQASDIGAVPTTRKVNNKDLSADITLSASDIKTASGATVETELADIECDLQLMDNIVGTTQIPTINTSTNMITQIQHKDSNSITLRTDTFVYQPNLIIETRRLASGSTITLKYHLDTLQVEVI